MNESAIISVDHSMQVAITTKKDKKTPIKKLPPMDR